MLGPGLLAGADGGRVPAVPPKGEAGDHLI